MAVLELSPQERRIQENHDRAATQEKERRPLRLLHRFAGTRSRIDIERGRYFTESFKTTEGEPLILRWAKALCHSI